MPRSRPAKGRARKKPAAARASMPWTAQAFAQEVADALTGFRLVRPAERRAAVLRVLEIIEEWAAELARP